MLQPENAIPIESWTGDQLDKKLEELTPILEKLAYSTDVRKDIPLLLNIKPDKKDIANTNNMKKMDESMNFKVNFNTQYDKISYYDNMIKLLDERIKQSQDLHEKYMQLSMLEPHKCMGKVENDLFTTPQKMPSESILHKDSSFSEEQGKEIGLLSTFKIKGKDYSKFITNSKMNPDCNSDKYFKEYNPYIKKELKSNNLIGDLIEMEKIPTLHKSHEEKRNL